MSELTFVPVFGTTFDESKFKGTTLVIPTNSAGMSAMIGAELFVMNEECTKAGYLYSEYISPMVVNDQKNIDMSTPG
jgi:hypothetical protein